MPYLNYTLHLISAVVVAAAAALFIISNVIQIVISEWCGRHFLHSIQLFIRWKCFFFSFWFFAFFSFVFLCINTHQWKHPGPGFYNYAELCLSKSATFQLYDEGKNKYKYQPGICPRRDFIVAFFPSMWR